LKERKQAIINQAVTKGLDPKVPMKDSGIEWLGKIPAHWEARKLKTCGLMKSGINLTSYEIENEDEYPVYGGNGLRGYYKYFNRSGDYLLIGRQGALCGNVHKVSGKFWATEHAVVVEPYKSVNLDWYYYILIVMNLNQYSESAAQPGLSVENIHNLKTCVPPFEEQKAIADYVDNKINRMDDAIKNIEGRITLIQEYRIRLISDVVTGKVNVQNIGVPKFENKECRRRYDFNDEVE
jgi:type I restriction enzyme S subunit